MAIVTVSAGTTLDPARVIHEGAFIKTFKYEHNGASLSVSDLVIMGYIAQGAIVHDAWIWGSDSSGGSTFKIGVGTTDNALSTAVTMSASGVNHMIGFAPKAFSLSSDAEGKLTIQVTVTKAAGTSTVTGSINLSLLMSMPPA